MELPHADRTRLRGVSSPTPQQGWQFVHRLIAAIRPTGAGVIAQRLTEEFIDASTLLFASPDRLERALPDLPGLVELLIAARELFVHSLSEPIRRRPILANDRGVLDYLVADMAHRPAEHVRLLYLNTKNELLRDEIVAWGAVNRVDISTREIVRRALELSATGMIIAHNHPSGDPAPSGADIAITRDLYQAARLFEIALLDHIIVARQGCFSFRAEGRL